MVNLSASICGQKDYAKMNYMMGSYRRKRSGIEGRAYRFIYHYSNDGWCHKFAVLTVAANGHYCSACISTKKYRWWIISSLKIKGRNPAGADIFIEEDFIFIAESMQLIARMFTRPLKEMDWLPDYILVQPSAKMVLGIKMNFLRKARMRKQFGKWNFFPTAFEHHASSGNKQLSFSYRICYFARNGQFYPRYFYSKRYPW